MRDERHVHSVCATEGCEHGIKHVDYVTDLARRIQAEVASDDPLYTHTERVIAAAQRLEHEAAQWSRAVEGMHFDASPERKADYDNDRAQDTTD